MADVFRAASAFPLGFFPLCNCFQLFGTWHTCFWLCALTHPCYALVGQKKVVLYVVWPISPFCVVHYLAGHLPLACAVHHTQAVLVIAMRLLPC